MNVQNYLENLNALNPLSPGLRAYFDTIAETIAYKKGQKMSLAEKGRYFFPFLASGAIKLYAKVGENSQKGNSFTYSPSEFLYHIVSPMEDPNNKFYWDILEDVEIIAISEKHYSSILKHFFDAYKLNLEFTQMHFNSLLNNMAYNTITNGKPSRPNGQLDEPKDKGE
ncbi:cyclic nucleotide-binding domain-containing protein [Pedobacter jamesrossensis]|uniref:Cyclic nucleotide-binding domain-containing protein n=1 Tax=Pedobacter jamesrossensis TaxID=1908238 RepID=A0ABV8NSH3_9SPHI